MTHRPRSMGGTDPLEMQLPYVTAQMVGSSTAVTADIELELFALTNDTGVFAFDPADPEGVLIQRGGTYFAMAHCTVGSIHQSVVRSLNILMGPLSNGPMGGDNLGALQWWLGAGQGDHSIAEVTATSGGKVNLEIMGLQRVSVTDPTSDSSVYRVALFLDHQGTNFTVTGASMTIIRIGTDDLVEPLPPNLAP